MSGDVAGTARYQLCAVTAPRPASAPAAAPLLGRLQRAVHVRVVSRARSLAASASVYHTSASAVSCPVSVRAPCQCSAGCVGAAGGRRRSAASRGQ